MTTDTQKNYRSGLIKLVHVARRELGLDEDAYRAILTAQAGKSSLAAMNAGEMSRVLEYLKAQGFKVRKTPGDRKQASGKDASKVRALWLMLHELGAVRDPSEAALTAYVQRIAKVDDVQWLRGDRMVRNAAGPQFKDRSDLVIETLKKWALRVLPDVILALKNEVQELSRKRLLSPEQLECASYAFRRSTEGDGFDVTCQVWENLRAAAGRPYTH